MGIALKNYPALALSNHTGRGSVWFFFVILGGYAASDQRDMIYNRLPDITRVEREKRMEDGKKLAAAMLESFKWETVYRRAVSYGRGETQTCYAWRLFAAYANRQLDLARKKEQDMLRKFGKSHLKDWAD